MKTYNKLPFKERQRQLKYSYTQTERQEELLLKKEIRRLEESKIAACGEQESKTDKERECDEVYKRLKAIERGGRGRAERKE